MTTFFFVIPLNLLEDEPRERKKNFHRATKTNNQINFCSFSHALRVVLPQSWPKAIPFSIREPFYGVINAWITKNKYQFYIKGVHRQSRGCNDTNLIFQVRGDFSVKRKHVSDLNLN
jgi:hypothetical protein